MLPSAFISPPSLSGGNSITISSGGHTFDEEGIYLFVATLSVDGTTSVASGSVKVADAMLYGQAAAFGDQVVHNSAGTAAIKWIVADGTTLASFNDENSAAPLSDYNAVIHWGDGSKSAGTISQGNGVILVTGGHTYTHTETSDSWIAITDKGGAYTNVGINVPFTDEDLTISPTIDQIPTVTYDPNNPPDPGTPPPGDTTPPSDSAPVTSGTLTLTAFAQQGVEGQGLSADTTLAMFTDTNPDLTAGDYTVDVTRSDTGETINAFLEGSGGNYALMVGDPGSSFQEEGDFSANITISQADEQVVSTAAIRVNDAGIDASPVNGGSDIAVTSGQPWTGTIATFTDKNPISDLADFTATVDYQDGNGAQSATIQPDPSGNGYDVIATHNFSGNAAFSTALITINDDGGSSTEAAAAFYATPVTVTAGLTWPNETQAVSKDPGDTLAVNGSKVLTLSATASTSDSTQESTLANLPIGSTVKLDLSNAPDDILVTGTNPDGSALSLGDGNAATSKTWTKTAGDQFFPAQVTVTGETLSDGDGFELSLIVVAGDGTSSDSEAETAADTATATAKGGVANPVDFNIEMDLNNDGRIDGTDDALKGMLPKTLEIDNQTSNGTGVPDFTAGFTHNTWTTDTQAAHQVAITTTFEPMQVTVPDGGAAGASIEFNYAESDPLDARGVEPQGTSLYKDAYAPGATEANGLGELRIWTKNGPVVRDGQLVVVGGDYVLANHPIPISELGFNAATSTVTLYVEAVGANSTYASVQPIKAKFFASPGAYPISDGLTERNVYNKLGWQEFARRQAGIDPSVWNPAALLTDANKSDLTAIYNSYQKIYLKDPTKFLWAGGARVAAGTVFSSLDLMANGPAHLLPNSVALALGTFGGVAGQAFVLLPGLPGLKPVITQWLNIAWSIFDDMAWQHFAYSIGGITEIHRLNSAGQMPIPTPAAPYDLVQAWEQIDSGTSAGEYTGFKILVDYEQGVVAVPPYAAIASLPPPLTSLVPVPMTTFLSVASGVRQPVPGMATFWDWAHNNPAITPWGGEDITNTAQRLEYMEKVLVPYWASLPMAQRTAYATMSIPDLMALGNL